ncbi:MAG: UDP-N-acetylmuramate dehydrogenase [Limnochordia bacterium]|jgi:UDP-N-acetylmuramate dehydrogenase|nr:UDP-N-acetylmuramate dehydrogenase [Bacillota bacterium]NLL07612.1 UDP-N-acetylmuramate dehydrogenase [Bacillota bacterium]HBG09747.1 UDP-N-acetylmuramate dehydrogenase [Bacillota bacterium]
MFLRNYPLANLTSLGVGGPADFFIQPANLQEVVEAQRFALDHNYPLTVIGYGTNLLIKDGGIRGVVVQIAAPFARAKVEDTILSATTGCLLSSLSKLALRHGLSGLEFAVGIPGGLGGAAYMNAGAYGGEIGPLVRSVQLVQDGVVKTWQRSELDFSYRTSRFQTEASRPIVTEVQLELVPMDQGAIRQKMNDLQNQRRSKQPLEYPSAGSTFKRPPDHYVGPLIEKAGLKGLRIGGAEVSTKHAGFIVKKGEATAKDFLDLIATIQSVIWDQFRVRLEPEIRILGED